MGSPALAARRQYDLILLDAMLPGLDGFSLLQQLRSGGSTTPVLMLTARSDVSDRVRGLDSGADYYLTKPFDAQELLACVRLLLRRSGGESRSDDAILCGDLPTEAEAEEGGGNSWALLNQMKQEYASQKR